MPSALHNPNAHIQFWMHLPHMPVACASWHLRQTTDIYFVCPESVTRHYVGALTLQDLPLMLRECIPFFHPATQKCVHGNLNVRALSPHTAHHVRLPSRVFYTCATYATYYVTQR